jgi:uncharacterized pyridoxamine 5'-phosphate oxidase family protein
MNIQSVIDFVNKYPICHFATLEGKQPRVRVFWTWFADTSGFYFHTPTTSSAHQQIRQHSLVEMCYFNMEMGSGGKMLRIAGEVELLDSIAIKTQLLEQRPFLKGLGNGTPDDPIYGPFRIHSGEAYWWTNSSGASPKLFFGKGSPS